LVWNPLFSREPVFPRPIPSVDPTMLNHPMPPECPSDSDGAAAGAAVLMALGARQKELLCALGHPVCVGGSLVSKRILEGSAVCFRLPILHRGKFSRASNEMGRRTHREHLKARPSAAQSGASGPFQAGSCELKSSQTAVFTGTAVNLKVHRLLYPQALL
jgi:hypothetical protein